MGQENGFPCSDFVRSFPNSADEIVAREHADKAAQMHHHDEILLFTHTMSGRTI